MQPLNAAPRIGLDVDGITGLLQTDHVVKVTYGAKWLSSSLGALGDLTNYMSEGSSIQSDITATIHRTCTLMFDSNCPVNYVTDFVQPYMVLTNPDTGFTAQFNLGVYTLASPVYDNSALPTVLTLTGYDLLYFLNQPYPDSYELAVGADPVTSVNSLIASAFTGASISYTDTAITVPTAMIWPFGQSDSYLSQSGTSGGTVTYLSIINEILYAIGYAPLWVDWNGTFQVQPYVTPLNMPSEWTFDLTDPNNIVNEARTSTTDLFTIPNYWVFVPSNLVAAPVEGTTMFTYIDENPLNPGSYPNRGRYIYKVNSGITPTPLMTYAMFVQAAMSQIAKDLSPAETFTISTSPFPLAWHKDRVLYHDPNIANVAPALSPSRELMAITWTLPLDGTSDMSWTLQTCTI